MKNFVTLVDHKGVEIMLTFISPALLKDVLRRAAVRQLECQAADKLQVGWSRVCFDVAKAETRKKKYTPLKAGTIRNLVCGGCWTAERTSLAGHALGAKCPRGGAAREDP